MVDGNTGSSIGDGRIVARLPSIPRQNWVLDPLQDSLFIIAAPLVILSMAIAAFLLLGAAVATTLILTTHIVMTVAHHLPTFIRLYGDVALFARHRWTFLIAPLLPLTIALLVGGWLIAHDLPVENLLYLFLLAVIWDPYHFLMQHYGFMRVYDRINTAPPALAARMDLLLCATGFVAIMLASGDWLTGLLTDLYRSTGWPLLQWVTSAGLAVVQWIGTLVALGMLAAYAVYLLWCHRQGHAISWVKLALYASTFGVMALAYTPNDWIASMAPGWSFKAGFAAVGIVHMTQYLAIVWRYNRGLAGHADRVRRGMFARWHQRGGWLVGAGYVALCLAYGELLTTQWDSRWLMVVLIAVGLTSTLMHYYFDGFIWKLRQGANQQHLALPGATADTASRDTLAREPLPVLARQLLYFGLPLALLTGGALSVWSGAQTGYQAYLLQAQQRSQAGDSEAARQLARAAYAAMNRELPIAMRLADLAPSAAHDAELALLIYNQSRFEHVVMPHLDGANADAIAAIADAHRERIGQAAALMRRALARGEALATTDGRAMRTEDAQRVLDSWYAELDRTDPRPEPKPRP